ncbi:tetratricopeptide repeat protein [Patescibacteria group bacterium]|nr:tetratricopeptide repeat protein [Patescibacteria group bacterium]
MEDISTTTSVRRFSLEALAVWALTITTVIAVLIAIPVSSIPFYQTKTVVLAVGALITLVVFALASLKRGGVPVPHLPLLGALWLVPIAYALSTLFSGVGFDAAVYGNGFSSDTLGLFLVLSLLATLAAFILRTVRAQRLFLSGLGVSFLLVLVSEVIFVLVGSLSPATVSPTSNFIGSFIDMGAFVGLIAIFGLLAIRMLGGARRMQFTVAVVISLFALTLVNSMIVWILVSLVALGLFVESVMYRNRSVAVAEPHSRPLVLPLITLVLGLLFVLGGTTIGGSIANLFGTTYIDARPSWQATFGIGTHTYAVSPIFGTGPNSFLEEWVRHHDRSINDSIFWAVDFGSGVGHVPTSFVTTGILGVLAWLGFFAVLLFFGVRGLIARLPEDRWGRLVMMGSFFGALYVLLLMVFALPGPVTMAVGFILLGLFIASLEGEHKRVFVFAENPRLGFGIVFLLTLLLIISIAAGYAVIERYAARVLAQQASTALGSGNVEKAAEAVTASINLAPRDETFRLTSLIALAQMNRAAADTTLAPAVMQERVRAAAGSAIVAGLEAAKIDPQNYQNWALLGNIYGSLVPLGVQGAYEEAVGAYTRAAELAPTNPALRFVMAQLEITRGNNAAAETLLIEAINLKRDYTEAILLYARLAVTSGKTAEALQAAEAAAYFAPNDPGVLLQTGLLRYAGGNTAGAIEALTRAVALNPQFANAHFYLGMMYALSGEYPRAAEQLRVVAGFSEDNAIAVAADIAALDAGTNPFPSARVAAFGIPYAPVDEPTPAGVTPTP